MVEFIAKLLVDSGIPPLILTRGYAGGDEARMLQRHFLSKSVQVGVGTTRAANAMYFLRKYGYRNPHSELYAEKVFLEPENGDGTPPKLGATILDDGIQHLQLIRDVNIVMVNGMLPWGNGHLIPLGPLREPLTALERAEIAVIHNADMTVSGKVVLCLSAIGSADAFVQSVEKLRAIQVDRLDFSDHHSFNMMDIGIIKQRLRELENESGIKSHCHYHGEGLRPRSVDLETSPAIHNLGTLGNCSSYQPRAPTRIPSSAFLRN